jgi:hypothetical protein
MLNIEVPKITPKLQTAHLTSNSHVYQVSNSYRIATNRLFAYLRGEIREEVSTRKTRICIYIITKTSKALGQLEMSACHLAD